MSSAACATPTGLAMLELWQIALAEREADRWRAADATKCAKILATVGIGPARKCAVCRKPLPRWKRRQAVYCSVQCKHRCTGQTRTARTTAKDAHAP